MTRQITLRKALQLKKTLAGDLAKLKEKLHKFNAQRTPSKHVDVMAVYDELVKKTANILELKTKLAQANVGIYEMIATVDEMKSQIAFFNTLNTEEAGREYQNGAVCEYQVTVAIDYTKREAIVAACQAQLDSALERIDEYNSTHSITLSF